MGYGLTTLWMAVHYFTTKQRLLPNSDISEISIVTMYLLYIVLYLQVIKMNRVGTVTGFRRGLLNPVLAILGSLFIFFGGMQSKTFFLYVGFSALVMLLAAGYYQYRQKKTQPRS